MKPFTKFTLVLPVAFITACSTSTAMIDQPQVSEPDPEMVFVRGYRSNSDTCQLVGESAFTTDFLDDAADLVACSTGTDDSASLNAMDESRVVTQTNSYTLYSVARR